MQNTEAPMTILEIREKLKNKEFEISLHAFEEAVDDFLSLIEVLSAVANNGEIIEQSPEDCRCLVHCQSKRQHIHVVFDYFDLIKGSSSIIDIVTIYRPDPNQWINYKKRRK